MQQNATCIKVCDGVVLGKSKSHQIDKRLQPYFLNKLKSNKIHINFELASNIELSPLKWTCMFCLSKHKIDIKNCSICGSSASSSSLTLENQNKQEKQSFKFNKSKFDFDFFNRDEMGRIIPIKKFFIQKKDQQQPASFIFNDKQENDTDLIIFASNESNSREQDMPFLCSKCCNESMITPIKPINDFNRKFNCIYNYLIQ